VTLTSVGDSADVLTWSTGPLISTKVKAVLIMLTVALIAFVAYGSGTNRNSNGHVATGRAYHSSDQAAVKVDGWMYGFGISPNGMDWYDAHGQEHDGGVPPCLTSFGYAWLRFGWSEARGLDGDTSTRVVTWVQCIDAPARHS
jgi:hypothetical protein